MTVIRPFIASAASAIGIAVVGALMLTLCMGAFALALYALGAPSLVQPRQGTPAAVRAVAEAGPDATAR